MIAELVGLVHIPLLSMLGLGIFFVYFTLMVMWVYRKKGRPLYTHLAALPVMEDDHV